jgi:hypothetical protein
LALAVVGCVAVAAVTGSLALAHHIPQGDPFKLTVSYHGKSVQGTLGSHCISRRHLEGEKYSDLFCADAIGRLPVRRSLRVRPGGRLLIRTGVRTKLVLVSPVLLGRGPWGRDGERFTFLRSKRARRVGGSSYRWRYQLPKQLRGATRLSVSIWWNHPREGRGDANFWAGIRER